ncbi:MAG: AraC family transcriptional regulator [Cyanobacteria bacterium P01_A01_bin.114]
MTATRAIHPSELISPSWVVSESSVKADSLKIEHHIEQPSELSADGLTHHLLLVNLQAGSHRQVTRIGKEEYDGPNDDGSFFLSAADDQPSFWAWDGVDEAMMFAIDPRYLQQVADDCGCVRADSLMLRNVVYGMDPRLEWFAHQFHAEMHQKWLGGKLYSESLGVLFALHLLRKYSHQPLATRQQTGLDSKKLEQVRAYIDAHLSEDISLAELAKVAGLSKFYFSEMFKQSLGLPPYRYVLLQRIERAKQCLREGNLPISDIALHCGFADQSHLAKHFRKSVGTTPRAFRDQ